MRGVRGMRVGALVVAVGGHTRMPRRYRGMDAFWWLERIGSLDATLDDVADPHRVVIEISERTAI